MPITGPANALDTAQLVVDAAARYQTLGDNWITLTTQALGDLSNIQIQPLTFDVNYQIGNILPGFIPPPRPTVPAFPAVGANVPAPPTLETITLRTLGDAPAEPDFAHLPQYAPPTPPTAPAPVAPPDTPLGLVDIIIPPLPTYLQPQRPDMFPITIPAFVPVVIPAFTGVRPTFDLHFPDDGEIDFTEIPYLPVIQAQVTATLQTMIQGGTGLPPAVERALFDRGRAREDLLSRKQVMEVTEDMASRGLVEPNGILASRLQQVRESNRDAAHGLNRDLTINTAQIAIEGMKFAVTQGIALESMLIQLNNSLNERALRVAIETRNYLIARVNAMVSYANLQTQAYATDATVYSEIVKGKLANLDMYKAQVDGQRLVGEINKDLIQRYEAEFRGLRELGQFYHNEIEGVRILAEVNTAKIEQAKLILQKFDSQVNAWGKLQDGYRAQVEGALGTVRYTEAIASVYGTRIQAYKVKGDAYFNEGRFGIERNTQTLDSFKSALLGSDQQLRASIATLDGQLKSFAEQVALYTADASVAQAQSASLDRTTQLLIENEKNRVTTFLQGEEMRINQLLKIGEIMVEQLKAKAAALSQLTASSQSAVNYHAGLTESWSGSIAASKSFSYSGGTSDADPGF